MREIFPRVLLVSLPWTAITEPSLGLAILKSQLNKARIQNEVRHLNLFLLKYMRASTYLGITNMYGLNDFLFTYVFEKNISEIQCSELSMRIDDAIFYNHFGDKRYQTRESVAELFLKLRNNIIPQFLIDCLEEVGKSDATMVGFTCMFDQTIASVALAKLLKEKFPDKFIVFGGYALEGAPGEQIIKSFDFVDCVCLGEGENVIESLAWASVNRNLLKDIPGILYRDYNGFVQRTTSNKHMLKMDESPIPDYDDFIADIVRLKKHYQIEIKNNTLPIETSRGCWWGQKKHCIFCGIDDKTMRYRQRSEKNTIHMLKTLREKYKTNFFRITDYILPNDYYKTLLPQFVALDEKDKYVFTCELKVTATKEKFELLKRAGFIEIQPGIESFSTNVLKKIDKGVNAIQNIYCLLLGHKLGIRINYNFLFGFPNDEEKDYDEMLKIIPLLYHLNPPSSRVEVAITRFSPLQVSPARFDFPENYKHNKGYNIIFSPHFLEKHNFAMVNYCYYFETPYVASNELKNLYRLLIYQIDYWRMIHEKRQVRLFYKINEGQLIFYDSRFNETPEEHKYNYDYAEVYSKCTEKITTLHALKDSINNTALKSKTEHVIEQLIADRFIFREGDKLIGLALNEKEYENHNPESMKWTRPYI